MDEIGNPAVDALVDALMDVGASLSQIVASLEIHRAVTGPAPPDATDPLEVTRLVLTGVLAEALRREEYADVLTAARLVAAAGDAIAEEVLFVPPPGPPPRPLNRRERRARCQ